jgi:acyl-CoA synthetase (AMP-forming)/AMP-acid ligase II
VQWPAIASLIAARLLRRHPTTYAYAGVVEGILLMSVAALFGLLICYSAAACGASLPLVDLAILDDAGNKVAQGERGEIAIRSVCNFREYWHRPDATLAAFSQDGYFLTGDIGYLDDDGYLFIVDRKKDIIIRGGENISCQEVEAAIYEHADVNECAVFGLPDERFGQRVAAVLSLAEPDADLDGKAIVDSLRDELSAYKLPRDVRIVDVVPRAPNGKADYPSARALLAEAPG